MQRHKKRNPLVGVNYMETDLSAIKAHLPITGENNKWVMLEGRRPGIHRKNNCLMIIVSQA